MDSRAHENILEVFSDQTFVKDIVKGSSIPKDLCYTSCAHFLQVFYT
jgi:hypothetical protein